MPRQSMDQMSELERELELELDSDESELEAADDDREAAEADDREFDDAELESALEEDRERTFGDRLADLASREFEDQRELELAIGEIVDDMEREYFFGKIGKLISKGGKALVRKGMKLAKNLPAMKALQAVTHLARGNMKGMLESLLQAGLASAIPGGALLAPALSSIASGALGGGGGRNGARGLAALGSNALGGALRSALSEQGREEGADTERFERLSEIAETAYEELAARLHEKADDPIEASRIAQGAFAAAIQRHVDGAQGGAGMAGTRRVLLRPGQRLVVMTRR